MDDEIKKLLKRANKLSETDVSYIEKHNLFSILKMENKEVETHSAFLYYLLNKENFDDDYNLREFINTVLFNKEKVLDDKDKIEIEREYVYNLREFINTVLVNKEKVLDDKDKIEIERECVYKENRIDFMIWINGKPVAVELKVWAGEQAFQLKRYSQVVKELGGDENEVYFLTPNGRKPETFEGAECRSFDLLKDWLEKLAEYHKTKKSENSDFVCYAAKQYADLITVLTKNYKEDLEKMELIEKGTDFEGIKRLEDAKKLFASNLLSNFFERLNKRINLNDAKIFDDKYAKEGIKKYYGSSGKKYPAIVYEIDLKERGAELLIGEEGLFFYIEVEENLYCGFSVRKKVENGCEKYGTNTEFEKDENHKALLEKLKGAENTTGKDANRPAWLTWKHLKCEKELINFKDFNHGFQMLISNKGTTKINETTFLNDELICSISNQASDYYTSIMNLLFCKE